MHESVTLHVTSGNDLLIRISNYTSPSVFLPGLVGQPFRGRRLADAAADCL